MEVNSALQGTVGSNPSHLHETHFHYIENQSAKEYLLNTAVKTSRLIRGNVLSQS